MAKVVNVQLLLDVESENEALDAVNEILREEQCSSFAPEARLIDYQVTGIVAEILVDESYREGDAFELPD